MLNRQPPGPHAIPAEPENPGETASNLIGCTTARVLPIPTREQDEATRNHRPGDLGASPATDG